MSEDIVPRIQELLRFCRSNRVPVVYLHTTKRKDLADVGIFADIKPHTHNADDEWSNFEGSPGAEFYEPVNTTEGDLVVKKFRYSGFYGTELENLLRAPGRDTIAIAGVATNVCCDSTARDGAVRDFKVLSCRTAMRLSLGRNRRRRSTTSTSTSAWSWIRRRSWPR
jgi:nicotinamidase-related amidase